jgi:hypothetical protein
MHHSSRLAPIPEPVIVSQTLYDRDLYDWSMQTARLLREGRYAEIDALHLAEEVDESDLPRNCPYGVVQVLDPSIFLGPDATDVPRRV